MDAVVFLSKHVPCMTFPASSLHHSSNASLSWSRFHVAGLKSFWIMLSMMSPDFDVSLFSSMAEALSRPD